MQSWLMRVCVVAVVGLTAAPSRAYDSRDAEPSGIASQSEVPAAVNHASFRELAKVVGVHCTDPDKGEGCMEQDAGDPHAADYFDVELLPDCDGDDLYAGVVAERGVHLTNKLPPWDTRINATLSKGQLVCVRALARAGQSILYYYIAPVPVSSVAACRGTPLCQIYGDRSIQWAAKPPAGSPCRLDSTELAGNCASGWAHEESLELFPLGLRGKGAE